MCCGTLPRHVQPMGHPGGPCGCLTTFHGGPCFATREEKIAWLEDRLHGLRHETRFVEERLVKLKDEK